MKNSLGPGVITADLYHNLKELTSIILKLSHDIESEGTLLPNSFYEANISLVPKLDKDTSTKTELQTNLFNDHACKNSQ
jgi:hypothetical protein